MDGTGEKVNSIVYREYRDDDYDDCMECIRRFYGDGYPYPEYLDRTELRIRTKSGKMIITVADTGSKVVGITGAEYKEGVFGKSVLLMLRNVHPDYRFMGIGSENTRFILSLVKERFSDALSVYADAMTHDAISQTGLERSGYTLCGIRPMLYKSEIIVPFMNYAPGTKMSQSIYVKKAEGAAIPKLKLYAPPEHAQFISEIYSKLKVEIYPLSEMKTDNDELSRISSDFREDPMERKPEADNINGKFENDRFFPNESGRSEYEFRYDKKHEKCEIYMLKAGGDASDIIGKIMAETASRAATWIIYLNMRFPNSRVYDYLKKAKFGFSGIKPLNEKAEYMIMAHNANVRDSFDEIVPGEGGKGFKDYIRRNKPDEIQAH